MTHFKGERQAKTSDHTRFLENDILCVGCGVCYIACPSNAIKFKIQRSGVYSPIIDRNLCTNCGVCIKVCPVPYLHVESLLKPESPISCYIGYSNNINIRWSASSGGLVSTALIFLFREKLIDGAVVALSDESNPYTVHWKVIRDEYDVLRAMGSKYIPLTPGFRLNDLMNLKRFAVVGLPCHIWGFRRLEEIFNDLKDRVAIYLGLFCGRCPNIYALIYFIRKYLGLYENHIRRVSFRGRGWPGKLTFESSKGEKLISKYGKWIEFSYYPHFIPEHCALCCDILNRQADISFGDAWGLATDRLGTSVAISRTIRGNELLNQMASKGLVTLMPVSLNSVLKGQGYYFKLRNSLLRNYIWYKIYRRPALLHISVTPKTSFTSYTLNLLYCLLLYLSRKYIIRRILCEVTPILTRLRTIAATIK